MQQIGRVLVALSCLVACSSDRPRPMEVEKFPIRGGTVDMGDPSVVIIVFEALEGGSWAGALCTGTLISPRVVLTAAHCSDSSTRNHQVYFGYNPYGSSDPTFLGLFDVTMKQAHPMWNPSALDNGYDVGLLLLEAVAPTAPKPMNRTPITNSWLGDPVRIIGYGVTSPSDMTNPVKRQATTSLMDYNFNLIVDGNSMYNTCQGDSGGPHFMTVGGTEVVVGVTSFGDVNCNMYGAAGRVDFFASSFIDPFVAMYDVIGCGMDGGCASGCGAPDPDCPCNADGFCTLACGDTDTDPDCPQGCGSNGFCVETGCPLPDPDCGGEPPDPCGPEGTCHDNCATRDPDCPLGGVGDPCNVGADCESNLCIAAIDDSRLHYCTDDCDPAGSDCPGAMICVAASGGRHVCIYDPPTPGALGSPCTEASECIDRICVNAGGESNVCVRPCDAGSTCPGGFECVPTSGDSEVCIPATEQTGGGSSGPCAIAVAPVRRPGALFILGLAFVTLLVLRCARSRPSR